MKYPKVRILIEEPPAKGEVVINQRDLSDIMSSGAIHDKTRNFDTDGPEPRAEGNLAGKGYWLSRTYDWVIVEDEKGMLVLVPIKKKK